MVLRLTLASALVVFDNSKYLNLNFSCNYLGPKLGYPSGLSKGKKEGGEAVTHGARRATKSTIVICKDQEYL